MPKVNFRNDLSLMLKEVAGEAKSGAKSGMARSMIVSILKSDDSHMAEVKLILRGMVSSDKELDAAIAPMMKAP
ncbi:MAG: hypothetical protein KGH98_04515 [Candidatus Micrarchaeota archaeon]|nr:hypothetical protein [Candidatus Micrarchaeota archaeon]